MANTILLLLVLTFVANFPNQAVGVNIIYEISGLTTGSSMFFKIKDYTGFNKFTLSVEDSIGKGLHFEIRNLCENEKPNLIFNTKTNGAFDSAQRYYPSTNPIEGSWVITAEMTGYLIEHQTSGEGPYTFPYRSPHQLSDINKIQLYSKSCSEASLDFQPTMALRQLVYKFQRITIEASLGHHKSAGVIFQFAEQIAVRMTDRNVGIYNNELWPLNI